MDCSSSFVFLKTQYILFRLQKFRPPVILFICHFMGIFIHHTLFFNNPNFFKLVLEHFVRRSAPLPFLLLVIVPHQIFRYQITSACKKPAPLIRTAYFRTDPFYLHNNSFNIIKHNKYHQSKQKYQTCKMHHSFFFGRHSFPTYGFDNKKDEPPSVQCR